MNKLLTKIVGVALGATMAVGVGVAAVKASDGGMQRANAVNWTSVSSLNVGDEVVFAYENGAVLKELSGVTTSGTTIGTAADYSAAGQPNGAYILTVAAGTTDGSYAFKNSSGSYLSWASGNSLTTNNSIAAASSWTITGSAGSIKLQNVGTTARKMQYNSGNPRWACYTSNQAGFIIYLKGGSAPDPIPEPSVVETNLAGFVGDTSATDYSKKYHLSAEVKALKSGSTNDKYGAMTLTDGTNDLSVYGSTATASALAWNSTTGVYGFTNPQDFQTNTMTNAIAIGDTVEVNFVRYLHNSNLYAVGIILSVTPGETPDIPEPAMVETTLADFIADTTSAQKGIKYHFSAQVAEITNTTYGNMTLTDGTNNLTVYGSTANSEKLVWDSAVGAYVFTNPQDYSTNELTSSIEEGDTIEVHFIRYVHNSVIQGQGIILSVTKDPDAKQTGTIIFGTNGTKIDAVSVTGNDSLNKEWTITTVMDEVSFTQAADYSQVGAAKKPATTIDFAASLGDEYNITAFSIKLGGFSGTAGTVDLKVDGTTVQTGSLNGTSDVTVAISSIQTGRNLAISIYDIAKGVKVYNITYTITQGEAGKVDVQSVSIGSDVSVAKGLTHQFEATVLPNDATDKSVTWASDDETVATVDANGKVTALAEGTAEITCTSVDNPSASDSAVVTVTAPEFSGINLSNTNKNFEVGKIFSSYFTETSNVLKASFTDKSSVVISISDANLTIKLGGETITPSYAFVAEDNGKNIQFSYTLNDVTKTTSLNDITVTDASGASEYADLFLELLSTGDDAVCDADGNTNLSSLVTAWGMLAEEYDGLSAEDKATLADGTASESGDNIAKALALYDYIGKKYNTRLQTQTLTDYNFMSRSSASASNRINPINKVNNTVAIVVVVTISLVSVSALGAYFLLRKKKEER